jgi:hypothetical protein
MSWWIFLLYKLSPIVKKILIKMQKKLLFRIPYPAIIILILCMGSIMPGNVQGDILIWAAGSTEKIQRDSRSDLPHESIWDEATRTVKVNGVRGEHVPFQIVVTADQENVFGITIKKPVLSMEKEIFPVENVRYYFQHIIKVYAPSGSNGQKGYWPDALVPLTGPFSIQSGERGSPPELRHQPVWTDIIIPDGQAPGIYKGTISIFSRENLLGEINIELTIWDITLPAERHFPALMRIGSGDVARMHELKEGSPEFEAMYYKYLEHALDNRIDPRFLMSFGMEGRVSDGNYILSWTDEKIENFFIEKGLMVFQVDAAPPGIHEESGEEPFSEEYREYVRQFINQVIEHARENGWYEKLAFLCPIDEPRTAEEYEGVRRWARLVREVDPDVNFMVTEQPLPQNPEWGSFVGLANYWIIHGNYLAREEHIEAVNERLKAGEKVIWYISCDQQYPQPNYFIDSDAADSRMIAWITWRYKLEGILYWTTTFWREVRDPWIDPVTWKLSECNDPLSGEGSLIYPGNLAERYTGQENVYGPVTSVRLELLREGFEELELLNMLKNSGQGDEADRIVESICNGIRDFTRDPNAIDEARNRIIQTILARK